MKHSPKYEKLGFPPLIYPGKGSSKNKITNCKEILASAMNRPGMFIDKEWGVYPELINWSREQLGWLVDKATEALAKDPVMVELGERTGNIVCIGDIHGNLDRLLYLMSEVNFRKDRYLVFLGDLIDRHDQDVEVLTLIFMLKIMYPKRVFILMGNHEAYKIIECHPHRLPDTLPRYLYFGHNNWGGNHKLYNTLGVKKDNPEDDDWHINDDSEKTEEDDWEGSEKDQAYDKKCNEFEKIIEKEYDVNGLLEKYYAAFSKLPLMVRTKNRIITAHGAPMRTGELPKRRDRETILDVCWGCPGDPQYEGRTAGSYSFDEAILTKLLAKYKASVFICGHNDDVKKMFHNKCVMIDGAMARASLSRDMGKREGSDVEVIKWNG